MLPVVPQTEPELHRSDPLFRTVDRQIVKACLVEDGWYIEVEDLRGVHIAYWIAACPSAPKIGEQARFFFRHSDLRLCGIAIDGRLLYFNDAS